MMGPNKGFLFPFRQCAWFFHGSTAPSLNFPVFHGCKASSWAWTLVCPESWMPKQCFHSKIGLCQQSWAFCKECAHSAQFLELANHDDSCRWCAQVECEHNVLFTIGFLKKWDETLNKSNTKMVRNGTQILGAERQTSCWSFKID